MKGRRGGRFAIFCWREDFSLYKVVASFLLPSHLPSLWFSVSRFMVKALEVLEPSAPSAPEMPPIRFSLLLLRALALKKPALSSHHLHTEDKKIAMNLHNKTMALDSVKPAEIYGKPAKVKWVTLEPFWALSLEWDFKDLEHSLSCLCGKAGVC